MRDKIHPKYGPCKITCACGHVVETWSTRGDYSVEVCSACHPVFTGEDSGRMIDSEGRVERFRRRYGQAAEAK
jgi:large subunit ribosomal protein L31